MDVQSQIVQSIVRAGSTGERNLPNLFARAAAATMAKARLKALVKRRRQQRSSTAAEGAATASTGVGAKARAAVSSPATHRASVMDGSDPVEQAASRAMWEASQRGEVLVDEAPFQGCILMDQATRNAMESS